MVAVEVFLSLEGRDVRVGRLTREPRRGLEAIGFGYADAWLKHPDRYALQPRLAPVRGFYAPLAGRAVRQLGATPQPPRRQAAGGRRGLARGYVHDRHAQLQVVGGPGKAGVVIAVGGCPNVGHAAPRGRKLGCALADGMPVMRGHVALCSLRSCAQDAVIAGLWAG